MERDAGQIGEKVDLRRHMLTKSIRSVISSNEGESGSTFMGLVSVVDAGLTGDGG